MTDTVRRGRGRPPTGTRVEANIPADILEALDAAAAELGIPRAVMIRTILLSWWLARDSLN